ncbi:hypothetical protein QJS10_CPA05g00096 [Acorus calamus]|uniref:Pentatricopeptide repeat-containing protein n=1 Tax=Acorus calamus TaxID=4465 RepID=A0AAV9ERH9_ACOCL|nr:hypothetical protein QJS10_CPA05g00096 [Acorus calamus]
MAPKLRPFSIPKRFPIWVSLNLRFSSSSCAARAQKSNIEVDPTLSSPIESVSAVRSLKNKLSLENLVGHTDSSIKIFRWASLQRNLTADTYCQVVLKLGFCGDTREMEELLREMVRSDCVGLGEKLEFLMGSLCGRGRLSEALGVFNVAVSGVRSLSISACNALLGAIVREMRDFDSVLFVYKEIVKMGIVPNVETLNCLIEGLCEMGHIDYALNQFRRMDKKGRVPNSRTFELVMRNLCSSDRVDEALKVLDEMSEIGCCPDRSFYGSIIPLLCRANRLDGAIKLFRVMIASDRSQDLSVHDNLISCLCENLLLDDAINLIEEMGEARLVPTGRMCVAVVKTYCKLCEFAKAKNFLDEMGVFEVEAYNALLESYCGTGRFFEAIKLLKEMEERGAIGRFSLNILIRRLCEEGEIRTAQEVVCRMIVSSYAPDAATYSSLIIGHSKNGSSNDALNLFQRVCGENCVLDSESYHELIEMLCSTKKILEAVEVFRYMSNKGCSLHGSSFSLLVREICQMGRVDEAIRLRAFAFSIGTLCNTAAYADMISGLCGLNKARDVAVIFSQMLVEGCTLDVETYCILVRALCVYNRVRESAILFDRMIGDGFIPDSDTLEVLLSCMVGCSRLHTIMHSLEKIIDQEGLPHSMIYNMIINGLWKEGHKQEASKFLDRMLGKGLVPDVATLGLLVGTVEVL